MTTEAGILVRGRIEEATVLLEGRGRGPEPRNADGPQTLLKVKEWILPWSLQKDRSPADP